jgi:hypothetical protein
MIVSLVCVVMLMLAYTQLFSNVSGTIGDARSMIELTGRMNTAKQKLRIDLAGVTCTMLPPRDPKSGEGYFEIIAGPLHDTTMVSTGSSWNDSFPILGTVDNVLMFTTRSKDGPFTGRMWIDANGDHTVQADELKTVQSEAAEVMWFLRPSLKEDGVKPLDPPTYTLYRKAFLVLPNFAPGGIAASIVDSNPTAYDWSYHPESGPSGTIYVGNTLGDLTKRECRMAHESLIANVPAGVGAAGKYPHRVIPNLVVPFGGSLDSTALTGFKLDSSNARFGEDVVLTNVVSFDVQVWDPAAPVQLNSGTAVTPPDPGFAAAGIASSTGAFVNLNWGGSSKAWTSPGVISPFQTTGHPKSQLVANPPSTADYNKSWLRYPLSDTTNYRQPSTYDVFSIHYEHDGIDQDGDGKVDQGTDGFDNNNDGVVDDINERETMAPYPVPLRGIKVTIRCYEPDSRQVHEVTIVESFLPQ